MDNSAKISVTEVRNALRCPRVFALGRLRRTAVAFPVGSSCMGGAFHRIVDRFAQTVAQAPQFVRDLPEKAPAEERRAALTRWIMGMLVEELERDPSYRDMPAEVDDLAEALRQLADYLAERSGASEALADSIARVVRAGEQAVEAPIGGVRLSGRIDALYARGERLDVVEYKLTDEGNEAVDRAQVALYRELLKRSDAVSAKPVVLRFNPKLQVTEVAEHRADELIRTELVPLLQRMAEWANAPETAPATSRRDLCAACPVAKPCAEQFPSRLPARDDPPMAATRARPALSGGLSAPAAVQPAAPAGSDEEGAREAEEIQRRILEEYRKDGINAVSPRVTVGPTVYIVEVSRPRGSVAQLDSSANNVIHRLADLKASFTRQEGRRTFAIQRANPRPVLLAPLLEQKKQWLSERPGRFVVGQEPSGAIVTADLADSATPHLLVAGTSGSGKSWLLRSIIASLVHWHDPSLVRITLLDPKRVTFNVAGFQSAIASHLDGPILYGIDDALPCLQRYVDVMEERYQLFESAHVADLHEYNDLGQRQPRHVIVIDEFQDLTVAPKAAAEFCQAVGRLGAKARAAGVHLILATQRPDAKTVPSVLKANLGGKLALRVSSSINSKVILDQSGAEKLLGKGDLLADLGHGVVRAQAATLSM